MRHSLSTALPRIFNSVDLASQSSRRSCGSLTTFLFYHVCLHSSRFCGRFFPFLQFFFMPPAVLFRLVFCRLALSAQKTSGSTLLAGAVAKREFLEISSVSRRKCTHSRRKVLRLPPPRAIFSLASSLCFLVPQSMLWYELEGTAAHRPVRFQYIKEYM